MCSFVGKRILVYCCDDSTLGCKMGDGRNSIAERCPWGWDVHELDGQTRDFPQLRAGVLVG